MKEVGLKRLNEPIYMTFSQRRNHRDRKQRLPGAGVWGRGDCRGGGGNLVGCVGASLYLFSFFANVHSSFICKIPN